MSWVEKFENFTKWVIIYTIFVILWGAFVRATGSGAGCGEHWPLCNGELIPQTNVMKTAIEFGHRVTSGFALILVLVLFFAGFKLFEKGHTVRKAVSLALFFILIEAALGAGLVLFALVENNDSVARAVVVCLHLLNTLGLLASLCWVKFSSRFEQFDLSLNLKVNKISLLQIGLLVLLALVTMSGGIVALGDTLFPAASFAEGFKADFDSDSHFLIRLRLIHPILAVITALFAIFLAEKVREKIVHPKVDYFAKVLTGAVLVQIFIGALNVFLLAPVWMQLVHLAVADLVWISASFLYLQSNFIMMYDESPLTSFLGDAQLSDSQ